MNKSVNLNNVDIPTFNQYNSFLYKFKICLNMTDMRMTKIMTNIKYIQVWRRISDAGFLSHNISAIEYESFFDVHFLKKSFRAQKRNKRTGTNIPFVLSKSPPKITCKWLCEPKPRHYSALG